MIGDTIVRIWVTVWVWVWVWVSVIVVMMERIVVVVIVVVGVVWWCDYWWLLLTDDYSSEILRRRDLKLIYVPSLVHSFLFVSFLWLSNHVSMSVSLYDDVRCMSYVTHTPHKPNNRERPTTIFYLSIYLSQSINLYNIIKTCH